MSSPSAPEPTPLAASLAALRHRLWRGAVFTLVIALLIGMVLAATGGDPARKLVYSLTISFACWAVHEALRLWLATLDEGWRRRRGLPEDPRRRWRASVPSMLVGMVVGPWIGLAAGDALTGVRSPSLLDWSSANTRVTLAVTLVACVGALVVLSALERLHAARAQAEAAQRQAAEHQLRLLQSQLEPHMLFNTLANLRVLIGLDPARAQAMLDRLIAFLRSTLAASRAERHPLAAEFERTADYLALMAVRMGARLQTQLALPDALRGLPVPPLLLQPLVENAIQHGLEPQVAGGRIEVSATAEGAQLVLTVRDTGAGPGPGPRPGGGFGLTQVRERLATVYGARATLAVEAAEGGGTRATVRLPLE